MASSGRISHLHLYLHRPEEAIDGAGDSVPMFGLGGGQSHGLDGTPSPLSLGMAFKNLKNCSLSKRFFGKKVFFF